MSSENTWDSREIWIGYSERRFKPICFQSAKDAHEWLRSVNPNNFGKCSVKHYRQVISTPAKSPAPGAGELREVLKSGLQMLEKEGFTEAKAVEIEAEMGDPGQPFIWMREARRILSLLPTQPQGEQGA